MATLNVVAIGDSVMWGQGHTDETKFVFKVRDWLVSQGHQVPSFQLLARSGATAAKTETPGVEWQEVPDKSPGVRNQFTTLVQQGVVPDVLLVDGGINDVSAYQIALADPFDTNGAARITKKTTDTFEGTVRPLLRDICSQFPKAVVVVTGYFPIVGPQTHLERLAKLLYELPDRTLAHRLAHMLRGLLRGPVAKFLVGAEHKRMAEQCAAFLDTAHKSLQSIVSELKTGGARISFANPGLQDENAYGAPKTLLWDGENDPLHAERKRRYESEGEAKKWNRGTPVASICHPNGAGATKYAEAIIACLTAEGLNRGAV